MKVASRFLLPVEMILALHLLAWAYSGGLSHGGFYRVLEHRGENAVWLGVLGGTGLLLLTVACWEWLRGRKWSVVLVYKSVTLRCFLSFISIVSWVYALYTVLHFDVERAVMVLTVTAPVNALFSVWCFVENLKVRYALDDRHSTSTLIFTR